MKTYKVLQNKRKIGVHASVFGDQDEFAIVILNDLTTIKKYEKERLSVRFQEMYLRSMAHNVRTPLNTIASSNEYFKMELTDPDC